MSNNNTPFKPPKKRKSSDHSDLAKTQEIDRPKCQGTIEDMVQGLATRLDDIQELLEHLLDSLLEEDTGGDSTEVD